MNAYESTVLERTVYGGDDRYVDVSGEEMKLISWLEDVINTDRAVLRYES